MNPDIREYDMINLNQTPETVLLVGGPADGRRIKTDGRSSIYYVPRINRIDPGINPRDPVEASYFETIAEEYRRKEFGVYMHNSICDLDVIDVLTAGYRCEIGI